MKTVLIDDVNGKVEYEIVMGQPFFHLKVHKWSKELFKEHLKTWFKIKTWFKQQGYDVLWVAIPNDEKLIKFEQMFGFKLVYEMNGKCLLRQEI